jgi:tRNA(5-methylaminomethyl-2-thiouridine)-methyltransferase-like protein
MASLDFKTLSQMLTAEERPFQCRVRARRQQALAPAQILFDDDVAIEIEFSHTLFSPGAKHNSLSNCGI